MSRAAWRRSAASVGIGVDGRCHLQDGDGAQVAPDIGRCAAGAAAGKRLAEGCTDAEQAGVEIGGGVGDYVEFEAFALASLVDQFDDDMRADFDWWRRVPGGQAGHGVVPYWILSHYL